MTTFFRYMPMIPRTTRMDGTTSATAIQKVQIWARTISMSVILGPGRGGAVIGHVEHFDLGAHDGESLGDADAESFGDLVGTGLG